MSKIFNDPIHGRIEIPNYCVEIIDTLPFQRLRNLKQLGFTSYVFPGATHTRFEHSIGVCYLSGEWARHLQKRNPELSISENEIKIIMISGLVHDIGHGPFSHTFERFIKLTSATYKLLEFFPEADPLKNRAKERALSIMESFVLIFETEGWASFKKEAAKIKLLEDITVLSSYFEVARSQSWISAINCLIILNEYEKIKKEIAVSTELGKKMSGIEERLVLNKIPKDSVVITERQGKIIEFLKNNVKAQVMDLQAILPDITKRTIRRDLDELLQANKIERMGEFNRVFYRLIDRT